MAPHATTPAELIARARAGEKCERCYGRGKADPYCYRCSDSTDDHHCPPPEPCDKCGATGRVVDPLAVELAAALEQLQAAVRTYLDQPDGWARQPAYQALRALLPPEAPEAPEAPAPGEPPSEPRPVYKAPAEGDW